jgi:hypothetical protein
MIPESTQFKIKYGGNAHLRKVSIHIKGSTVPQARRQQSNSLENINLLSNSLQTVNI